MDSRERVFLALNHETPDRVPIDFWASTGSWKIVTQTSGMTKPEFLDAHDIDLRYIEGPAYIGAPIKQEVDIWGVRRRPAFVTTPYGVERYDEVADSPLAGMTTVDEIDEYTGWPSPDDYDYSVVREQAKTIQADGRIAVFMGDRLNRVAQLKPAMYLRGVEQIFLDFAASQEIAQAIIQRIITFYKEYLTRILDAADGYIDIVLTGDDFGQQRGLLIGESMWDAFLAPGFETYLEIIRDFGAKSMHHTCGDVRRLTGRFHELGLDILQSLQPEAMGDAYKGIKDEFGDSLCFHGGISIQSTMPQGTAEAIADEVIERVQSLAGDGGYILCTAHNIQADCPYANIVALLDAYAVHGIYP
jgi:uroporphyrinogen decarboxylase